LSRSAARLTDNIFKNFGFTDATAEELATVKKECQQNFKKSLFEFLKDIIFILKDFAPPQPSERTK